MQRFHNPGVQSRDPLEVLARATLNLMNAETAGHGIRGPGAFHVDDVTEEGHQFPIAHVARVLDDESSQQHAWLEELGAVLVKGVPRCRVFLLASREA